MLNCGNAGGGSEEVAGHELKKDITEGAEDDEAPPEAESTVSAERIRECTALEFKCRCVSGYSIRTSRVIATISSSRAINEAKIEADLMIGFKVEDHVGKGQL